MKAIKTVVEFEKQFEKLIKRLTQKKGFCKEELDKKESRIRIAKRGVWSFAKIYLEDYVSKSKAPFHREFEKIRKLKNEVVLLQAFRGAGKSTYFSFLEPLWEILFGKSKFMVFCSYTHEKSVSFTERILAELLYNKKIKNDFGSFSNLEGLSKESRGEFIIFSPLRKEEVKVKALSVGQDPRGLFFKFTRPDYVRLDDVESSFVVKNEERVKNSVLWILKDLCPALGKEYSMLILGTPINANSVICALEEGFEDVKGVKTFKFPLLDKDGQSAWKGQFSVKRIEEIKKIVGSLVFRQEYLLEAMFSGGGIFNKEHILYYQENAIQGFNAVVSFLDLAVSNGKNGDFKAMVVAGKKESRVYVLSCKIDRDSIESMMDYMFYAKHKFAIDYMFYESNGSQVLFGELLKRECEKRGEALKVIGIENRVNKEHRIESTLMSRFERGEILFLKDSKSQETLIDQILSFPNGKHDDAVDALEGAVRMLFKGELMKDYIPIASKLSKTRRTVFRM